MAEAKHEFIDDNPYLVYSPDAEATASGSGGGGGDAPIFKITDDVETGALSEKASDLSNMVESGLVYLYTGNIETGFNVAVCVSGHGAEDSYKFIFANFSAEGENPVTFDSYVAASGDDYPVYDEG